MVTALDTMFGIAAITGIAFVVWSNIVFLRLLREVNAKSEPSERIDTPYIKNHALGIINRHRELYPESGLRRRVFRAMIVGLLLAFAAFCGAVTMGSSWSDGDTGSEHTHH